MDNRRDTPRNAFGRRLEQLLLSTNVKSATVAAALSYDVSYISKWITGKALPSRKNVEKVLDTVSAVIIRQGDETALEALADSFGVSTEEAFREAVAGTLRDAYCEATGELNDSQYRNNAALRIMPRGAFPLLGDLAQTLEPGQPRQILVMADLFALDHASKLQLAGIDSRQFRLKNPRADIRIDYVIDLDRLNGESVYDVILLIHMMTNFSQCDFRIFSSEEARDKLILAVREEFAGVTVLAGKGRPLYTTDTRDHRAVEEICETVQELIDPDKRIFYTTDMAQLLRSREYFHNLLSQNNRWLVGHVTEHFLPEAVFTRLREQYFAGEPELGQTAEQGWMLASNMLRRGKGKLMLYHLALVDFVLSGELDFFNRKVMLPPEARYAVLENIRRLLQDMQPGQVKLVREGFSDDFKYITNPCVFLSDSASYLRLENKRYSDNLLRIKDESAKEIFDAFFEKIWNLGDTTVLGDHGQILEKLDNLLETVRLM